MHRLFEQGYITLSSGLHLEVSRRLREEVANGGEVITHYVANRFAVLDVAEYSSKSMSDGTMSTYTWMSPSRTNPKAQSSTTRLRPV